MNKEYIIQHRYCKAIKIIEGKDIYDAMHKAHLEPAVWQDITAEVDKCGKA